MSDEMRALRQAKYDFREEYGHRSGITSFGIGADCLRIGVEDAWVAQTLPQVYKGFSVELVVTGVIRAQSTDAELRQRLLAWVQKHHIERYDNGYWPSPRVGRTLVSHNEAVEELLDAIKGPPA